MTERGKFIVLEGCEGAGKTTQVKKVVDWLTDTGRPAVSTREPGGTPFAESMRSLMLSGIHNLDPITQTLGMFTARMDHCAKYIEPTLAAGFWMVCDRYYWSTYAYQCASFDNPLERHLMFTRIRNIVDLLSIQGLVIPDATIVLNIAPELGLTRIASRGGEVTTFDTKELAFHSRVQETFLNLLSTPGEADKALAVNANRSEDEVTKATCKAIESLTS